MPLSLQHLELTTSGDWIITGDRPVYSQIFIPCHQQKNSHKSYASETDQKDVDIA